MKIKQATRYHVQESTLSISIFYLITITLCALGLIPALLYPNAGITMNGIETSTMIFFFVLGLNCFKPSFSLFLQNGISRKTLVVSFHLAAGCIALAAVLVDNLFPLLYGRLLNYHPIFADLYRTGSFHPMGMLWKWCMYLMLAEFGFLLTSLTYRMNKAMKLLFYIGVPVLLFLVLPLVGSLFPGLRLFARIGTAIGYYMGMLPISTPTAAMLRGSLYLLLTGAVWAGLSWLLVRRATLKAG